MQSSLSFLVVFLKLHVTGAFQIRLSGGPNLCVGRVEILHKDEWGTVCDDDWDLRDVAVVCRELNCGEALSAPHGAWFGEGVGSIWLNEVHCAGTERHLLSCHHRGFRKHICTHEEDASAICSEQRFPLFTAIPAHTSFKKGKMEAVTTTRPLVSPTPTEGQQLLRLVDGPESCAGRVEVLYKGQWGTVCDDGWDLVDAAVVCRELDCGAPLLSPGNARYGPGSGPIWLDDVNCTGREFTIKHCHSKPWGKHNCNHHEDASVICTGKWKRLLFQKPIGSSKATELPISITSEPVSPSNSELQNVMDVAEITTNIQEFPDKSNIKSLNQSYTEDPFLKTPSVKIEQENETKPINPSDIVESTLSPNILQHTQAKNSYKFPKTRLSTRKWKKESISSTENFQPSSITWDTESKREIRSTTPGFVDKTIYNSENPQHVQEMEPAISSKIMSSFQNRREMPISQSIEFKSLSMWDIESDRERPSGAGPPPFAQSFNSAPERLPSTYWDSNAEVSPLTKNIEFNDIFNENQDITTATWIQVPEKVISTSDMRNELFELSNSFEVTKEVELPITTKNLQSEKRIETTTPKVIDYEEKSNHEKQEESNIDPHPVEPSGLTKTSDANVLSAKPVTYSEHCESSPDCLIKQEQSKADQRCCCSPQALRNLVHTMKGLHGELGSVSVAIKNQGSQLEAVAHNLAELSASIRLLVAILPSLVQPGSSQSFLSPSGQVESQLENQLPLK
ncbi:soluble scavenger receptor cysteine-rich domain-containing protein SSC5D-like isoform X2 [Ahaetulla prasina]|uniref:soluble scavenger receptor cysteine-rich domain-containing protein SSC5D-like isoform X2 n=1 Tax=Ahaetulla prasina TaxID=499056 RepID=UPI0026473522|nr:soluble scavenger receptor cysteine-rich domain-containing protein SSC5D-like isoform X2 [Ahaetulla prasina]